MTKASSKVRFSPGASTGLAQAREKAEEALDRSEQLIGKEAVHDALLDIFKDVQEGFDRQADRADTNLDYWDVYNCVLGGKQFYNGNSQIFVPIVHSAIEARQTRFVNQIFPVTGRYVEAVTENGDIPYAETALLEHYVRKAKLRTMIAPALMKNADIEGQMTVQVTWEETKRNVVHRMRTKPELDDGISSDEEIEDIMEEELIEGRPVVRIVPDADLLVLPFTADSIEEALREGGSVTTLCRWSKAKIKRMIASGEIDEESGEDLLEGLQNDKETQQRRDKQKAMVDSAGIKGGGRGKFALVYRTWTYLTIGDDRRLCLAYYGGERRILGCKRNPYWSDRIDIISASVDKIDGSFKGKSKLSYGIADLQYHANDACNEGADSAQYALLPIIMTDPEKNPKIGQMVLSMAAVWETSPTDTQFAKFPPLWKDALELIAADKQEIFQALSVNPAQITQATPSKAKRPSQAEVANEQQIDILTTASSVTVPEEEIFTPMLSFMLELDHQYRDKMLKVREFGPTGMRQNLMEVDTIQLDRAYSFRWFGVEQVRNMQRLQQQTAAINVVKGIPPQLYQGYRLDLGPVLANMFDSLFGPRLGPLTLRDARMDLSIDPETENKLMLQGFVMPVSPGDDFQKHMQVHQQALNEPGHVEEVKVHMQAHMMALQAQQQAMQAQQQGGAPGAPPGGGGGPRQGATPGAPRGGQAPPGAIHQDRIMDPGRMPRPVR